MDNEIRLAKLFEQNLAHPQMGGPDEISNAESAQLNQLLEVVKRYQRLIHFGLPVKFRISLSYKLKAQLLDQAKNDSNQS